MCLHLPSPSAHRFFPDVRSGRSPKAGTEHRVEKASPALCSGSRKGPATPYGGVPNCAPCAGSAGHGGIRRSSPIAAGAVGTRREVRESCPGVAGGPWSLGSPAARVLPAAARRAVGGTGSRVSAALPRRRLLSFKSSRGRSEPSFVVGSLSPPLPRPPPRVHLPDAGLSRHRRRVPPGAGREGRAHGAGLGGGPTSRELPPPPRLAAVPRPQHRVPPAHHLRLPACGLGPHPGRPPAPEESREGSFHPVPRRSASSSSLSGVYNLPGNKYLSCSLSHPRVPELWLLLRQPRPRWTPSRQNSSFSSPPSALTPLALGPQLGEP